MKQALAFAIVIAVVAFSPMACRNSRNAPSAANQPGGSMGLDNGTVGSQQRPSG